MALGEASRAGSACVLDSEEPHVPPACSAIFASVTRLRWPISACCAPTAQTTALQTRRAALPAPSTHSVFFIILPSEVCGGKKAEITSTLRIGHHSMQVCRCSVTDFSPVSGDHLLQLQRPPTAEDVALKQLTANSANSNSKAWLREPSYSKAEGCLCSGAAPRNWCAQLPANEAAIVDPATADWSRTPVLVI